METSTIIAIAVIALVVVALAAIAIFLMKRRNSDNGLESRYGAEYRREVKLRGRSKAENELTQREERVSRYDLRPLVPEEQREFSTRWTAVQAEFVDAPRTAAQHADVLMQEVKSALG